MEKMDYTANVHLERHLGTDATKEEKAAPQDTHLSCQAIGQSLYHKASLFLKGIFLL